MYYLLKPDTTVLWSDASEYMIDRMVKDHPELQIDLGRLDWQPAERRFDAGTLNIALRYGTPVADGLAVAGRDLVELDYYRTMEAIVRKDAQQDSTNVSYAGLFEQMMPGWRDSTRELDQRVLESNRATFERAEQEMTEAFKKPIDPALSKHWQNLGGGLPPQNP